MKKKLKSRRGVTIVELLVAVILLTLLTAGGITATSAVMSNYVHMSEATRAEILASTVMEALTNEIRLGRNISVAGDGNSITLDSVNFGVGNTFTLNEGHLVVGAENKAVLSEKTYGGLTLSDLSFKKPDGARTVTISFKVEGQYDGQLCETSTAVAPLTPAK